MGGEVDAIRKTHISTQPASFYYRSRSRPKLGGEPVPRILIAHGQNFLLRLAFHQVIALPKSALFILPIEIQRQRSERYGTEPHQREIDGMALSEVWLIISRVEEGSDHTGNVAQHDLRGGGCGPFSIARIVGVCER